MYETFVIKVVPKRKALRSQRWWVEVESTNGEPLLRSTEGYASRSRAVRLARAVSRPEDVLAINPDSE